MTSTPETASSVQPPSSLDNDLRVIYADTQRLEILLRSISELLSNHHGVPPGEVQLAAALETTGAALEMTTYRNEKLYEHFHPVVAPIAVGGRKAVRR